MSFSRRARIIAASIGTSALLAATATVAVTAASAAPAGATAAGCKSSAVQVWTGSPGDDAAGHSFWQVEISNVSHHTCTLFGYPGVSELRNGHQVGKPAGHSGAKSTVTIPAGGTAHFVLTVTDAFIVCAHPVKGTDLKVFPPGQFKSQTAPFAALMCKGKVTLRVDAVHAGTGIPGHTTF